MRLIQGKLENPTAESFENLCALNGDGIYEIKPFNDWTGAIAWKEKIFSMRLCNAGEILDIHDENESKDDKAELEFVKFGILSRSILSIDGRTLINEEELTRYNEANKTDFQSPREWISIFLRNLEKVVVDRLDAVYGALQLKQARQLQGNVLCGITNKLFPKTKVPAGSFYIKYGLAEILTPEGIALYPEEYQNLFDVISATVLTPKKDEVILEEPLKEISKEKEGESFEERKKHMEKKDNNTSPS